MADEFETGRGNPYLRTRPPVLGRMSVFVIGLLLGAAIGAFFGATGWPSLQPLVSTYAPAASAKTTPVAAKGPAPAVAVKVAKAAGPIHAIRYAPQAISAAAGQPVVIGVFGDSMADGLWAGLYRQLRDGKTFDVVRYSQSSTGLSNYQYVDVQQKTIEQLGDKHLDIAVVMFGANDEQGILSGGAVYAFGTPGWRTVYTQRLQALVALLRLHGAAVYWVGLPRMERAEYDRKAGILNDIYEEQARALGVTFIPTVQVTEDPDGSYDAYLSDGGASRPRLMRAKDGIHMTMAGYLRIAAPVSSVIRADVARASPAPAPASPGPAAVTLASAPTVSAVDAR